MIMTLGRPDLIRQKNSLPGNSLHKAFQIKLLLNLLTCYLAGVYVNIIYSTIYGDLCLVIAQENYSAVIVPNPGGVTS